MVIFGDFQRDKASQIGAHSIKFSSAPAVNTSSQIGMCGVTRQHPCGSMGTLQFPITASVLYNSKLNALYFLLKLRCSLLKKKLLFLSFLNTGLFKGL